MRVSGLGSLDFLLPPGLEAQEPPEIRAGGRDDVRLMVSRVGDDDITHAHFRQLPDFLDRGDVLVVNTSATINAAFDATRKPERGGSEKVRLHLSTPLTGRRWAIELRRLVPDGTVPLLDAAPGERIQITGDAYATLSAPLAHDGATSDGVGTRLWQAELSLPSNVLVFAEEHGHPIRYSYVPRPWPLSYYQTVFAVEPGSAEMPSAGRAFTWGMIQRLTATGIRIVPIVLHAGVASLETGESPYPERFRVPRATANTVNEARRSGNRVVAVGTTVVRALESVAAPDGEVHSGDGWTDVVVTPERGVFAVDALLTGLHAPRASHLSMLEALAGADHLVRAYSQAIEQEYRWHEFGDLHLIL